MAQIDWMGITSTKNNYFTSVSGTAVQHNTLSNPITSSGTWFRNFTSNASNTEQVGGLMPINNSLLTSSVGYPYGYTYSIRTWMRLNNPYFPVKGLFSFKSYSNLSVQDYVNTGQQYTRGYSLMLKETGFPSQATLSLSCVNNPGSVGSPNSSLDSANNNNAYTYNIISNSSAIANTWVRLRMDVMSLPDADRITVFTGSQVQGFWSQIHQVNIPRTKTAAYIPWYNNPSYPSDNTGAANSGYMGIISYASANDKSVCFDGFEVYREAITI